MLLRFTLLICLCLTASAAFTQKKTRSTKPNLQVLPADVTYSGNVVHSVSWKDKDGKHLFIATESGINKSVDSSGNELNDGTIIAKHYILSDTNRLTWTEGDSITGCQTDADLGFMTSAFQLTDIDADGFYELWLIQKSACRSDVSPAEMQLVMHEGNQRFTMIGQTRVKISETESIGGQYDFNNLFLEGNPKFKKRGMDLWNDFMKE